MEWPASIPIRVKTNPSYDLRTIPAIGPIRKIKPHQTPEESWGRPITESQIILRVAKIAIKVNNLASLHPSTIHQ